MFLTPSPFLGLAQAERLTCRWDAWLRATVCEQQGQRISICKPNRWTRTTACKGPYYVSPANTYAPWQRPKGRWSKGNWRSNKAE